MFDKEKRFNKVITFYQSLPNQLLEEIISNLSVNRDFRRKISKIKSDDNKVKKILSSPYRVQFVDAGYNTIKNYITLDLEKSTYDDIINCINDENKLYVTLFFFRWCYETDENRESNDDKYFDTFVDSELFQCIISGRKINEMKVHDENDQTDTSIEDIMHIENSVVEKTEIESTIDDNKQTEDPVENNMTTEKDSEINIGDNHTKIINQFQNSNIESKGDTMKLLGCIEKKNTFYNFFPQYELVEDSFIQISTDKLKSDYPTNGGINLAYNPYHGDAVDFLNDIPTDHDDDRLVKNLYVIEIDNYDLEENSNDTYRVKLDLQKLIQKGKKLDDIIRYSDDYDVYKIVTSESVIISDKTFINGNIILSEDNITEGELVVLYYNEKYYGPFKTYYRTYDNKYYISASANENNYLVPYYSVNEVKVLELEKRTHYKEPTYTNFIQTTMGNKLFEDIITDEILLDKITDDISLDLAISKPEEFSHLCSNSPFLAKLPRDIISKRIKRLFEIVNNVNTFKEKKHEIFDSLLKIYQEVPSEVSEKMITDSEIYKELHGKYNEERRKNEDSEKQIQELIRMLNESNDKIEVLSKPSGTVSSEEKAQLQAKIQQLENELNREREINDVSTNIETLKEEQKKLKHNNEFLNDQAKEYEERIKSARSEISNAIEDSKSKMASLAFDPFIANKMLKEAASWESDEENGSYKKRHNDLLTIEPSELCGTELVDYIVNYVKERREYCRNDIINIYISIAQNFITIFSGEPGTGKTSMCNIVAETLGLLNFGDQINRFVSISVERGWSSKRDLIGYYNPLTKKYDKSNSKIYDALRILDVERDESKYPFIIMLDEANLSPIEYYWADFMRLTDRTSKNDMYINIGADREIYVPETLKFVATINTDQTTESLSPRLIDRACIIKLPKVEPKLKAENITASTKIITWNNFISVFSKKSELNPITQKAIKEIYKLFNDYGMIVSPRIQIGINKYVMAAQEIMEDESDALAREKALDFAIVQKLLPKINGYYSLYERFFDSMRQLCKEYSLYMTEEAISKIIDAQERNMGYCQYLI